MKILIKILTTHINKLNNIFQFELVGFQASFSRIIGGGDAEDSGALYQCSMQINDNKWHFCTCAIISKNWIISSAHCVKLTTSYGIENVKILIGSRNRMSDNYRIDVKDTKVHEVYNKPEYANDIGLIKVDDIDFGLMNSIQIKISEENIVPAAVLTFYGWGLIVSFSILFYNKSFKCIWLQPGGAIKSTR